MDFTVKDMEKLQKAITENDITVDDAVIAITNYTFYKRVKDYGKNILLPQKKKKGSILCMMVMEI